MCEAHTVRVTGIEQTKRGRYSIFLDDEFYCALHVDVFAYSTLNRGGEVALEYMEELRALSERRITRERALRLLGQRSYTEKGLRDKLRERTDEENAEEAVARMVELGLVNDEDYARRYASDCLNLKRYSLRRTAQELRRKGIDRDIADAVLEEFDVDPERAVAAIVTRKYLRYLGDEKGVQKTMNALVRLGYGFSDIRAAIANLQEDEGYYDD